MGGVGWGGRPGPVPPAGEGAGAGAAAPQGERRRARGRLPAAGCSPPQPGRAPPAAESRDPLPGAGRRCPAHAAVRVWPLPYPVVTPPRLSPGTDGAVFPVRRRGGMVRPRPAPWGPARPGAPRPERGRTGEGVAPAARSGGPGLLGHPAAVGRAFAESPPALGR